jgi:hypothetical protein
MAGPREAAEQRAAALADSHDRLTEAYAAYRPWALRFISGRVREQGKHAAEDLRPGPVPVVTLACTACQLVYEPDLAAFGTGKTGCPRCGGWTWIAQLGTAERPAPGAGLQHRGGDDTCPSPAVLRPRNPAGPDSPTTNT